MAELSPDKIVVGAIGAANWRGDWLFAAGWIDERYHGSAYQRRQHHRLDLLANVPALSGHPRSERTRQEVN